MQNLTSSLVVKKISTNASINKFLFNEARNSFRNLNFQYDSCRNVIGLVNGKRNLIIPTGLCKYKNKPIVSEYNVSKSIQTLTHFDNFQNQQKWQSIRFFSKCNINLDKENSNAFGNDKVKIDTEKFLIGFTCKKCNNRSYKFISKKSYYEGVVIIRCDKCKNLHLIADHLGWYDSMNKFGTIEDYFKRQKNNASGKTIIKKNLQQLTKTEQDDVIEFLKEEQKESEEKKK